MSKVKDMSLAKEGIRKIEWVQRHMPVLEHIKKEYEETQPFKGITIGSCLHLEPKTINLGLTLQAGGAEVSVRRNHCCRICKEWRPGTKGAKAG